MNPNSASRLELIEEDHDYGQDDSLVYMLHCTNTNTVPVFMMALDDAKWVEFPAGSFAAGAVYPIYIKKLKTGSDVKFIAYKYHQKPISR